MEAESKSRLLESKAREVVERVVHAEQERDAARHEVVMARLEIDAACSTRAQMEYELARVQRALATSKDPSGRWSLSYTRLSRIGCFWRGLAKGRGGS